MQTSATENRIVTFTQFGGPEVLTVEKHRTLEPGSGEVRIRMTALALNRANAMFREGTYLFKATFPSRVGSEGVGIVDKIGPDVDDLKVGQRVCLIVPDNESAQGYAADFNIVSADSVLPAPEGLDDRHAATAWVPFLTIYHCFVEEKQASEGRWIVLPAASSSVSLAANALAHHLGARTIGITRTKAKIDALKAAGYDEILVSADEDLSTRIIEITGDGADFVFDPVGGEQLENLVASTKRGGQINVYGALDPRGTTLPVFALMNSAATISCYTVYELLSDPSRLKVAVEFYLPLFQAGTLSPATDRSEFSLEQISNAFGHMESNTQFGKVIVTW